MRRTEIDFTQGSIYGKIIKFIIPIIGAYLIQQAYSSADLIFAGQKLGNHAAAAIGASNLIVVLAIGLCGGLSVGTGIMFSKAYGAKDKDAQRRIGSVVLLLSLFFGGAVTVAGVLLSRPMLMLMQTPGEILDLATSYIQVYFPCLVPMMLFNMTAGILRGKGNSAIPMIFQTIAGGLNVLLDALFIAAWTDGIVGVALASIISQGFAAIATYVYFIKTDRKELLQAEAEGSLGKVDEEDVPLTTGGLIGKIFSLGIPVGLQSMMVTLSNVFIQANINQLGVDSISAFTAYFKVELFIYYPIMSLGQAAMFMVGQNLGAKRYERIRPAVRGCINIGIPLVLAISTVMFFFGNYAYAVFNPKPEVINEGMKIFHVTAFPYFIYVILEVLSNAIRSYGKTKTAMIVSVINYAAARAGLLALYNALGIMNISWVASVYPITWLSATITFYIIWKKIRDRHAEEKSDTFEKSDLKVVKKRAVKNQS